MLWRALRSRHALTSISNRTQRIAGNDILSVSVMRNEMDRLPYFLDYYRKRGVGHFLIIDNASTDGTDAYLRDQPDVSLWSTPASYRDARFGLDWMTWLQMRYCHGHWCLMLDADELLVHAHCDTKDLRDLTQWLDQQGQIAFGALMLDLYPQTALGEDTEQAISDPFNFLKGFDAGPFRAVRQTPMNNLWVQGGARERAFFGDVRRRSPTLNKLPLVKWHRRYACVNSCHAILPSKLNMAYSGPGADEASGVLLHTKFLPSIVEKSNEEKHRKQHFRTPAAFDHYYGAIAQQPTLWHAGTVTYTGWQQLEALQLMSRGGWDIDPQK